MRPAVLADTHPTDRRNNSEATFAPFKAGRKEGRKGKMESRQQDRSSGKEAGKVLRNFLTRTVRVRQSGAGSADRLG